MTEPETLGGDLSFYLNFVVLNAKEVVKGGVQEKVGSGLLGGLASKMASVAIDADSKVTEKLGSELSKAIPETTAEMGLDLSVKTVYQKGSLVVFKFTVNGAEPVKLITSAKGEEAGAAFENIVKAMDVLEVEGGVKNIEAKMLPKIKAAMMTNLAEKIPAKMEAKGLKVDCSAQETATEADWFFDFLEVVKTA